LVAGDRKRRTGSRARRADRSRRLPPSLARLEAATKQRSVVDNWPGHRQGSMPRPGSGTWRGRHGEAPPTPASVPGQLGGAPGRSAGNAAWPSRARVVSGTGRAGAEGVRSSMPGELQWIWRDVGRTDATPPRAWPQGKLDHSVADCWPAPNRALRGPHPPGLRNSTDPNPERDQHVLEALSTTGERHLETIRYEGCCCTSPDDLVMSRSL